MQELDTYQLVLGSMPFGNKIAYCVCGCREGVGRLCPIAEH